MPVLISCVPNYPAPVRFYTNGSVEVLFEYLYYQPPFDDETLRLELLRRLNEMPGVNTPADKTTNIPPSP